MKPKNEGQKMNTSTSVIYLVDFVRYGIWQRPRSAQRPRRHREKCEMWLAGTNVRESTELHNEFKRSILEKTQKDMGKCCLIMSI